MFPTSQFCQESDRGDTSLVTFPYRGAHRQWREGCCAAPSRWPLLISSLAAKNHRLIAAVDKEPEMKDETPQRGLLLPVPAPFQLDGEAEGWSSSVDFQRCFHVGANCWCCGPTDTSAVLSCREKVHTGPGEPPVHRER